MTKPHEQLEAWKLAMLLVKSIYELTAKFPVEERYGLAQQMRRAAVSIPSNIAEGAGRNGAKEFLTPINGISAFRRLFSCKKNKKIICKALNFIGIARGSLAEVETQLQLAVMLKFVEHSHPAFNLANNTGKLLTGLHKKLSTA